MTDTNVNQATTTGLADSTSLDYTTPLGVLNEEEANKDAHWNNDYWAEGLGILQNIPEYKEPIRALARWTCGKGYECDSRTKAILDNISGWGEDSFQSIMTDMIVVKKTNGDAYAEQIRNEKGDLINLKKLNPGNVRIIVDEKGLIKEYAELNKKGHIERKIPVISMFHICNDRVANQIHGTPAWQACKWELEAKREAQISWRKIIRRSHIRVIYVDMDNPTKLNKIKSEWKTALEDGEAIILPGKKGQDIEVETYDVPPIDPYIKWIQYLDNRIYQSLGISKAIADTSDFSEAASKTGYLTFEPTYTEEQTLLEQDIWAQLALRIKFHRPPSLSGTVQEDEQKNTGQLGFQQNDTKPSTTRTE